jgi:hypothetical protein
MDVNIRAVIVVAAPSSLFANGPYNPLPIDGEYHTVPFMLSGLSRGAWR